MQKSLWWKRQYETVRDTIWPQSQPILTWNSFFNWDSVTWLWFISWLYSDYSYRYSILVYHPNLSRSEIQNKFEMIHPILPPSHPAISLHPALCLGCCRPSLCWIITNTNHPSEVVCCTAVLCKFTTGKVSCTDDIVMSLINILFIDKSLICPPCQKHLINEMQDWFFFRLEAGS